jgi:BlaI family penicillinase repressor
MPQQNISITNTEWNLMECLWEASPRTGREATDYMQKQVGWTRSTTLTMLRRMTEKGLIRCEDKDGMKVYSPLVKREDAALQETEDFLGRVYKGSLSLMVSSLTKKQSLPQQEIDELYSILREMEASRDD